MSSAFCFPSPWHWRLPCPFTNSRPAHYRILPPAVCAPDRQLASASYLVETSQVLAHWLPSSHEHQLPLLVHCTSIASQCSAYCFFSAMHLAPSVQCICCQFSVFPHHSSAQCNAPTAAKSLNKGGRFCENNFLKILIGSQPILERRSWICDRQG